MMTVLLIAYWIFFVFFSATTPQSILLTKAHHPLPFHIFYFRGRIHERTILLRFLGIILRVLILEVSEYNVYITNQFQTTFAQTGGGGGVRG
jgi:hypothetical protein